MRQNIVGEVGGIVPDIETLTQPMPVADIICKGFVAGVLQWSCEVAFYGAESYDHIWKRLNGLRRFASVLVCQRVDGDIWILLPDSLGDIVHQGQHGTGMTAFPVVDR